ncbi:hypothetical protein CJJ23_01405 [Mycoplasmopsis agassizii]|uniref:Lipoprotein n=1 Tax=Mycoplasmopsis agassizii TaxID=33922 RepID=A0A269TKW5_9BACT|nr:aromatic motif membrane protein [Mycoplasmopsis agassizii]PAK21588.1 hypothetical protein CJJ23_01405 [Mycoplasmopsis agassizii]
MNKKFKKFLFSILPLSIFATLAASSCSVGLDGITIEVQKPVTANQDLSNVSFEWERFLEQPAIQNLLNRIFEDDKLKFTFNSSLNKKIDLKDEDTIEVAKNKYVNYIKNLGEKYLTDLSGWLNIYNIALRNSWQDNFDSDEPEIGIKAADMFDELNTINWLYFLFMFNRFSFIGTSEGIFNDGGQFGRTFSNKVNWFMKPNTNVITEMNEIYAQFKREDEPSNELEFNKYFYLKMANHAVVEIRYKQRLNSENKLVKNFTINPYINVPFKWIIKEIEDFKIKDFALLNVHRNFASDSHEIEISEEHLIKLRNIAELDISLGNNVPYYLSGVNLTKEKEEKNA